MDISNIYEEIVEEIVEHVPNKTYLQNVITLSYEGREVKRLSHKFTACYKFYKR